MQKTHSLNSRLTINGFTINPILDPELLASTIRSLSEYDENHLCDFGHTILHKNYLGKSLNYAQVFRVDQDGFSGLQGHIDLTNGWITIRTWDNVYPSEVLIDIYVRGEIGDPDLILDHFCSPAMPHDSLGLFDYTYSLNSTTTISTPIQKFNKKNPPYLVNSPIVYTNNYDNWEGTLNKFPKTECHFCKNVPVQWVIIGPPWREDLVVHEKYLIPVKTVAVCELHIEEGKITERKYPAGETPEIDFVSNTTDNYSFERSVVKGEDGQVLYGINNFKELD